MSDASQTKLSYRDEDTWGETPTTPSPQGDGREFRFTSESLIKERETVISEEIRDDRNIGGVIRVAEGSSGPVNIESSFGSHDQILTNAFFSNWTAFVDVNPPESPEVTVTVTASITSPFADSTGTIAIPAASPDRFASIRIGDFVELSGTGSPDISGFFLVTAKPSPGNLTVQPSPASSQSGAFRVRSSSIRNGTIFKSMLIEKEFRDVAQFFRYTGMRCATWSQNISPGSVNTGDFSFLGEEVTTAAVTIWPGSPAVVAVPATDVLNAVDNISNILIDGATPIGINFTEISFSMDNQLRPNPALGTLANVDIRAGQVQITGTLASYFLNLNLFNLFNNFTTVRLSFVATDAAGNSYLYFFPAFKVTTGEVVAGGNNTDVLASFEFTAFRDATLGFAMGLNRFPTLASTLLPITADQ